MSPYGGMLVEQSKSFRETVVPNVTWMLVDRAVVLSYFWHLRLRERRRAPGSVSGPLVFRSLRESRICDPERTYVLCLCI